MKRKMSTRTIFRPFWETRKRSVNSKTDFQNVQSRSISFKIGGYETTESMIDFHKDKTTEKEQQTYNLFNTKVTYI